MSCRGALPACLPRLIDRLTETLAGRPDFQSVCFGAALLFADAQGFLVGLGSPKCRLAELGQDLQDGAGAAERRIGKVFSE